ncbi:hypothetical protein LY76DRAFT_220932 [Colletotrichum caudatum]|nr:hypothetical protein LY76DRAFT_220932 [Colletotrichum caudatum]
MQHSTAHALSVTPTRAKDRGMGPVEALTWLGLTIEHLSERPDRFADDDVDSSVVVISHANRVAALEVPASSSPNRFLVVPQADSTIAARQVILRIVLVGHFHSTGFLSLSKSVKICQAGFGSRALLRCFSQHMNRRNRPKADATCHRLVNQPACLKTN